MLADEAKISFGRWVIRWRWIVILLTLMVVGLSASGARFLRFDTDYRIFFSKENPQLAAFESMQNTYSKNDNVLFVLAPASGNVFTPESLAIVKKLTDAAWKIPYSLRVDSITNFQNTAADEDDLVVADLVEYPEGMEAADLERVRRIALAEPFLVHRIVSPAGDVTGVNVTIHLPGKDQAREVPEVAAHARKLAADLRAEHPDLTVHLTGMAMMNNAFPESAKRDMATLVPIMFLVVVGAVWVMIRSITGTLATLLVILFSIVTAMGLGGWLGFAISGPVSAAPTIILTMGVADCIHVLMTTLFVMGAHDMNKRDALVESLRINFNPVFLTSFTTMIGFLAMNSSEVPPFRTLGNIVAMGVVAAWVYSITFLPALVAVLPMRARSVNDSTALPMDRFADFVLRRRRVLLWGTTLLVMALGFGITRNQLNDEFVKYFSHRLEFRQATDFTSEWLTGIYMVDFSPGAGQVGGVSDPAYLNDLETFAQWLRQQPEVIHVNTLTDVFKRLNRSMHGGQQEWYRLPDSRELSAQYLLLYEMSLPYGLDLNNQVNVDKSATRLSVTLRNISSNEVIAFSKRARAWLEANTPPAMHVEGASPTVMFANIGQRNIQSMLKGSVLSIVLISISLIVFLRSVRFGLLSMIPNLVPIAMGFGLWGYFVGEVGLALSVVGSMTLGIVVDDTIHFLSKYLAARREMGKSPEEAVHFAFHRVGNALWVTTVVLVAGFMVLAYSDFKLNSSMGMLTGLTLAIALFMDFLMLPPLLLLADRTQGEKKS